MSKSPFGQYLRQKRVEAGLSLRDVAAELGLTFVYLGEVERGVRGPLKKDYWKALAKTIPGITVRDLERQAKVSRPVQLEISDAPPQYQDLAMALARRVEKQDIGQNDLKKLLKILRGDDDD